MNLAENITDEDIQSFFEGENIRKIGLPKKYDGACKGFGYVVFESKLSKQKMIKKKRGAELKGEKIILCFPNKKAVQEHIQAPAKVSKTLFVGNLDDKVTENDLKEIFQGCNDCRIPKNDDQSKGYGFVTFENVEAAEKAKAEKHGLTIKDKRVYINFGKDKSEEKGGGSGIDRGISKTLFVGNLDDKVTEDDLKEIFQGCNDCRIPKKDGQSRGYGFVTFENVEAAVKAKAGKHGLTIKDQRVYINFGKDKSEEKGGGSGIDRGNPSKTLYMGNLDCEITKEELKAIFPGCKDCRILPKFKRCAFIEFESIEDAEKALVEKNGLKIQNLKVRLAFSQDKPRAFNDRVQSKYNNIEGPICYVERGGSGRYEDRGRDERGDVRHERQNGREAEPPMERPRLHLQHRTKSTERTCADHLVQKPQKAASIFWGAKSVDTAQPEREIKERLMKQREALYVGERSLGTREYDWYEDVRPLTRMERKRGKGEFTGKCWRQMFIV